MRTRSVRSSSITSLWIGAAILGLAGCSEPSGRASAPSTGRQVPTSRRSDADSARWIEADREWPVPPPLAGVTGYELPRDEAEWIARCLPKLESSLGIEAIRYAKEMLAEKPTFIERYGKEKEEAIRTGTHRLGMTKTQVMHTRGNPPGHETTSHDLPVWKYWSSRFINHSLAVDDDAVHV